MTQKMKPWAQFMVDKNLKFVLYPLILLVLPIRLLLLIVIYLVEGVIRACCEVATDFIDDIKNTYRQKKTRELSEND